MSRSSTPRLTGRSSTPQPMSRSTTPQPRGRSTTPVQRNVAPQWEVRPTSKLNKPMVHDCGVTPRPAMDLGAVTRNGKSKSTHPFLRNDNPTIVGHQIQQGVTYAAPRMTIQPTSAQIPAQPSPNPHTPTGSSFMDKAKSLKHKFSAMSLKKR